MNPTTQEHEYVLGTNDAELTRLGFQHRLWSGYALAMWERAGFAPRRRILDVGCGPGFASIDMAYLIAPSGTVIGVDESARFLDHARALAAARGVQNLEFRHGDVQKLDLPATEFHGAYARWVLCFVPDPEAVVAGVAKSLKPGGTFAVQDYVNYRAVMVAPTHPVMGRVAEAVDASVRQRGGDLDVGARLPGIMERYGLRVREVRPLVRIGGPESALWQWPTTFFSNYLPVLVEHGLLTRDDREMFERMWTERTADPLAFFMSPPMVEVIGEKRG